MSKLTKIAYKLKDHGLLLLYIIIAITIDNIVFLTIAFATWMLVSGYNVLVVFIFMLPIILITLAISKLLLMRDINKYVNVVYPSGIMKMTEVCQRLTFKIGSVDRKTIVTNFNSAYTTIENKYLKKIERSIFTRTHEVIVKRLLRRYNISNEGGYIFKACKNGETIIREGTLNEKKYSIQIKFLHNKKLLPKALYAKTPIKFPIICSLINPQIYLYEHYDDEEMNVDFYKVIIKRIK